MADLWDEIIADIHTQVTRLSVDWQDDEKNRIGVPVERIYDDEGNLVRVIRSKPGEYPRKDSGALQSDLKGDATIDGLTVEMSLTSGMRYAPKLVAIQREMFDRIAEEYQEPFLDAIVAGFNKD